MDTSFGTGFNLFFLMEFQKGIEIPALNCRRGKRTFCKREKKGSPQLKTHDHYIKELTD